MFSQIIILGLSSLIAAQNENPPAYNTNFESSYVEKPMPYSYGYDIKDDYGGAQYRKEESNGYGKVKGSYGYADGYGLYRHVDYIADEMGFRAYVKTNEPGTNNKNPADVEIRSHASPVKYDGPSSYDQSYPKTTAQTYKQPETQEQQQHVQSQNYQNFQTKNISPDKYQKSEPKLNEELIETMQEHTNSSAEYENDYTSY